ncbi:DUF4388 domain-containing protein [Deinococcus oregonensis]|uniref:DUF4388 domain-containing protein n=1 Tax=Deinococcus oregonensis TaxID=1805970 RepID=A0ABV6B054_9DEIO
MSRPATRTPLALLIAAPPDRALQLSDYLRLTGLHLEVAESALAALTQLERLLPDVVVCDAHPGDLSGEELLEIVRSDPEQAELTFVLLTDSRLEVQGSHDVVLPSAAAFVEIARALSSWRSGGASDAVSGCLDTLGLAAVLEALAEGERSGILRLQALFTEGQLYIAHGHLVQAQYGMLEGEEAAVSLMQGARHLLNLDYVFEPGAPQVDVSSITTPTALLLASE